MFVWTDRLEDVDLPVWDALVEAMPRPSPFMSARFLVPWAASFAGPLRIGIWREDRGLIFLHRSPTGWELLGGQDLADRLDALVRPADAEKFWRCFLKEAEGWGEPIRLPNLGPDCALLPLLEDHRVEQTDTSPFLELPPSMEDYYKLLSRHQRHELKRKQRRAQRLCSDLRYRVADDLDGFLRLHVLSGPEKEAFMDARMREFFHQVGTRFRGHLRIAFLEADGQPAAAMFQLEWAGRMNLYNSGFDPALGDLTPGVVLLSHCIRSAIEEGLQEYDFLRGNERYKYDLGGQDRPVLRATLFL